LICKAGRFDVDNDAYTATQLLADLREEECLVQPAVYLA
jgi:hypothetical protein